MKRQIGVGNGGRAVGVASQTSQSASGRGGLRVSMAMRGMLSGGGRSWLWHGHGVPGLHGGVTQPGKIARHKSFARPRLCHLLPFCLPPVLCLLLLCRLHGLGQHSISGWPWGGPARQLRGAWPSLRHPPGFCHLLGLCRPPGHHQPSQHHQQAPWCHQCVGSCLSAQLRCPLGLCCPPPWLCRMAGLRNPACGAHSAHHDGGVGLLFDLPTSPACSV